MFAGKPCFSWGEERRFKEKPLHEDALCLYKLAGKQAVKAGGKVQVHLKVDTGMGRLGLLPESRRVPTPEKRDVDHAVEEVKQIAAM